MVLKPSIWLIYMFAILCITSIELYALSLGHNGYYLSATMAAIGAVLGYLTKTLKELKSQGKCPEDK